MSNEVDYRLYVVSVAGYFYPHNEMRIWVKCYKTKRAIADKVHYPGTGRVRKYISSFNAALSNHEEVTLYWNGREFFNKAEYDFKLANLQKHWRKVQAERDRKATAKAEIDAAIAREQAIKDTAEATVNDVLRFLNGNSNVKPDIKAGQGTSEGRESIDRCEGVTQ